MEVNKEDGGKGEAVGVVYLEEGQYDFSALHPAIANLPDGRHELFTAPQAECAPLNLQAVFTELREDFSVKDSGKALKAVERAIAAPTPERADMKGFESRLDATNPDIAEIRAVLQSEFRPIFPELQERAEAEKDAALKQALDALRQSKQFIENGIEFRFIRMPCPGDPALYTLPTINAAIAAILAANKEK